MEKQIIFGAPGCGKTTYLLDVLEKELKHYEPNRIAFISFTRKGAKEGLVRAREKFKYREDQLPYFRTLHSLCFKILNVSRGMMLSKVDYKRISDALSMRFMGYYTEEFYHNDDRYLFLYFLKKNNYEMYKKMRDSFETDINKLKMVAHNYNRYKEQFKKIDFTDLLENVIINDISVDVDVAIIDEAQDLTTLQWKVVEQLFNGVHKMYIAGDDDQAIYEWTGADVKYFLGIEGERVILNKSWRLQSKILSFAKNISKNISMRVDKDFKPYRNGGVIKQYNTIKDFEFNEKETYFCLARNNYFLTRYERELKRQAKIFIVKDKLSVDKNIIFAINNFNSYVSGILDKKDAMKIERHLRPDVTNIKNRKWYEALNLSIDDAFYYRKLIENKIKITEPKIFINTIHGVKGGEADNVILLMDVTKSVYNQLFNLSDSELRVLYVGITRAKKAVHIIHSESNRSYTDLIKDIIFYGEDKDDK